MRAAPLKALAPVSLFFFLQFRKIRTSGCGMFDFGRRFQTDDNGVLKPLLFGDGFRLRHTKSLCNFYRTVGELHFFIVDGEFFLLFL